jgi:hypothetical protein
MMHRDLVTHGDSVRTAVSKAGDARARARELSAAINGMSPVFVMFFATPNLDPKALGRALRDEFGDVPSIGCTTAGEIGQGQMLSDSVVLVAMGSECLEAAQVGVIDASADAAEVQRAMVSLAGAFGRAPARLDPGQYVGLVLHDGLSLSEERVMAALTELTNVPFVGGSAGDALAFRATHVFHNFEAHSGKTVLGLLAPRRPYRVLKTQSFDSQAKVLVATRVDEASRRVIEFNGRPAAREYADQLGVPLAEAVNHFQRNPVGIVMPDGAPFVRSPMRIDGGDLVFYCQIKEGMELSLLSAGDMVAQTSRDLNECLKEMGGASAIINFHCILRTLQLESEGRCAPYGELFTNLPAVGFSTYGESYIGHMNQTSTMLLLG